MPKKRKPSYLLDKRESALTAKTIILVSTVRQSLMNATKN